MLAVRNLRLATPDRVLIEALDWSVAPGQCWCIVGRNGAGKSTLLRTLAGMHVPQDGSVLLGGREVGQWPLSALARERALLPQGRSDAFGYRVLETVLSARHPYQDAAGYWDADDDRQAALMALQDMDVAQLAERDVRSLSGGERQRVAIAAVLAQDTPLLLLDEPANALDLSHQLAVMRRMRQLCSAADKAVVMVSHDLNLISGTATHVLLLMGDGSWQAGPAQEILSAPLLSRCLGQALEAIAHRGRTVFVASDGGAP